MSHQYARRTFEEATELARLAFKDIAQEYLAKEELEEIDSFALLTGGTVGPGWEQIIGFIPDGQSFYELQIYKPANKKPYIEKSYVRILSPRDRAVKKVHFMWHPPICT
jgi:uncharacterized protein YciU (UPF0263 family)